MELLLLTADPEAALAWIRGRAVLVERRVNEESAF
jgi:hypothetical protein